jgi:hypothetical protein
MIVQSASAGIIFLDADTPATGSDLDSGPLVTPYGTITFAGEIRDKDGDPEFDAAGASGDVFDILDGTGAQLLFDFDVASFTFIYGGNAGVMDITAFDAANNIVDSFFQASTEAGQPAGPEMLSGVGIRRVFWQDPGFSFSAIDNVTIVTQDPVGEIPEPASMALFALGAVGLAGLRRRTCAA